MFVYTNIVHKSQKRANLFHRQRDARQWCDRWLSNIYYYLGIWQLFSSEVVLFVGAMFYLSSAGARFAINCYFCRFVVLTMSLLRLSYLHGLSFFKSQHWPISHRRLIARILKVYKIVDNWFEIKRTSMSSLVNKTADPFSEPCTLADLYHGP